jgi:hypothetical protein
MPTLMSLCTASSVPAAWKSGQSIQLFEFKRINLTIAKADSHGLLATSLKWQTMAVNGRTPRQRFQVPASLSRPPFQQGCKP